MNAGFLKIAHLTLVRDDPGKIPEIVLVPYLGKIYYRGGSGDR
jgi:hypothetical protein